MRPVTGARLKTGQNPVAPIGTATRLTTGMRPTTRGGGGAAGGATLNTSLCIEDRPITHQGLGGLKTGVKGPRRQIEDRSYFFGVLRNKINEISTELATIVTQNEEAEKESQSFIQYEQMAEQLASELRNLQGELGDYNTLVDKATIGHDIATIELDWEEIKQEAMRLFGQLHEVEAKRDQLLSEAARHEDPQMERERLLAKVREDNRETANMDREIRELNEKVRELEDSIQQVGQELEDHQCSLHGCPVIHVFSVVDDDDDDDGGGGVGGGGGGGGGQNRGQELTTLKKNIATMEVELETFSDLDAVRESSEDKRKSLLKEQERYSTLRNQLHEANQRLSNEYSETQLQLSSQDTHIQLTALEKKLVQHEQTAYALREAVALKREETAYEELANQARALVADYNDILKRSLSTKMPI
nr:unnamed protein product [Spirometra erinaceieuropaei]